MAVVCFFFVFVFYPYEYYMDLCDKFGLSGWLVGQLAIHLAWQKF